MEFKSLKKKKRDGFTLVEMVIVVTILGILSGIGFMKFGDVQQTSRTNADYVAAANLATAANLCLLENPSIVTEEKGNKTIKTEYLKENGYINFEPKCQTNGGKFEIIIKVVEGEENMKSEELFVVSDGKVFYPKGANYPFNDGSDPVE